MKKKFLCALLVITTIMSTNVFASDIDIFLNGDLLSTTASPVIENGTVMVPFRDIFEALGMDVSWDASTKTVSGNKNGTKVVLSIGHYNGYINGAENQLTAPPQIVNGKTMVPVRFVAEAAGYPVKWDGDNSRVIIGDDNIIGDIYVEDGKVINAAKLYAVDGTGEYAGYKKLMGHPYEDVADLYFKHSSDGDVTSSEIMAIPKYYDRDQYMKWTYNGESYVGKRKDIYEFLDLAASAGCSEEFKNTFGSMYYDWVNYKYLQCEGWHIVQSYLDYIDGISSYRHTTYVDVPDTTKNPTTSNIDGVVDHVDRDNLTESNKETESKSAYDDEFFDEWISENDLKNEYGWDTVWLGNTIMLMGKNEKKITINNAPKSKFEEGKIYHDGTIKFQYVNDFTANGETVTLNSIYFEINGLKAAGIIN